MKTYLLRHTAGEEREIVAEDRPSPQPEPGEVVVKMHAASLNYRDLLMKKGLSASSGNEDIIPGSDGAGEVSAVGEGVSEWQAGDRVALTFFRDWVDGPFEMKYHQAARGGSCDGVLAEEVLAPAHSLVRIPDTLDFVEAACLPCAALTAWHALFERGTPLAGGETVLCLGTGGVSICALQMASAAGARVAITSSSDEKLERAAALGAEMTVNYAEHHDWDEVAFDWTGKHGIDHIVEVGGPGTLGRSMRTVAPGGKIALIGVLTGFDPPSDSLFPLVSHNAELHGIYVGSRAMFERMNAFLAKHGIRPSIDQVFAFDEVAAAYARLASGRHFGKVAVAIS